MGEFTIECTLCGETFGCEKDYDSHPCTEDDVKVPFKIKLEQGEDEEEAELETETERMLIESSNNSVQQCSTSIKEEPEERMDFDEEDLLDEDRASGGEVDDPELDQRTEENVEEGVDSDSEDAASINSDPNMTVTKVTDAVSIRNECGVCGKRFYRREDFLNHTENSHKVPRPYQCKVCKKRFTQKHYVTLHMRVHTGERPYKCGLCTNTYTHKTSYTIHMRIHNGERPYMCGVCGKKCYDKSGLTSHMRSHTKETPYQCEVCGRRFTHSKSLLVHRRNHTGEKPYECQYCGKCFRHWHKHKIHIRLHTGERPYRCKVCGKGFPRNDEVKRHMRSHQGIKSFKCSICGIYCATQASITGHIDLHHADLKQVDPSAPEKTVVRDSNSGTLGTKAPQPRTIYKPINSYQSITESSSQVTTATTQASSSQTTKVITSNPKPVTTTQVNTKESGKKTNVKTVQKTVHKTKESGKTKSFTYKEFLELQDKLLREKANASKTAAGAKDPKTTGSSANKGSAQTMNRKNVKVVATSNAGTVNTNNLSLQAGLAGKQIMVLANQGGQLNGSTQLVLPHSLGLNKQVILTTPTSNVGPRFVIQQPTTVQSQVGGQQMVFISQPGSQQNPVMLSQPVLLLSGGGGQRMILMPSKTMGTASTGTPQKIVIAKTPASVPTTSAAATTGTPQPALITNIKKEAVEPVDVSTPKVVIKQEPGVSLPGGIVIKQEPVSDAVVSSSNMCNVVIKQEPQDTYE